MASHQPPCRSSSLHPANAQAFLPSTQSSASPLLDDLSHLYHDPSHHLTKTQPPSSSSINPILPAEGQAHKPPSHARQLTPTPPGSESFRTTRYPSEQEKEEYTYRPPQQVRPNLGEDRRQAHFHTGDQDTDDPLSERSWHDSQTPTQASSPSPDTRSAVRKVQFTEPGALRSEHSRWFVEQQHPPQPHSVAPYWQNEGSEFQFRYDMDLERSFPQPEHGGAGASTGPAHAYVYTPKQHQTNLGTRTGQVPLINYVTNDWRQNEKYHAPSFTRASAPNMYGVDDDDDDEVCCCGPDCEEMVKSKAFRRYMMVVVLVLILLVGIIIHAVRPDSTDVRLRESIKNRLRSESGFFGSNAVADLGYKQLKQLERWRVPGSGEDKEGEVSSKKRRLIIVGDIHGCADELKALLQKVNYDTRTDTIITTGDVLSKGPASLEVLHILMSNNASCVRGNHEDRILLARRDYHNPAHSKPIAGPASGEDNGATLTQKIRHGATSDLELAADLSAEQAAWLEACPVILDLGPIAGLGGGGVAVVHSGLVPVLPLARQDPFSALNMRSIDLRSHFPSRNGPPDEYINSAWTKLGVNERRSRDRNGRSYIVAWPGLWNAWQALREPRDRQAVVYGHDSDVGVNLGSHTWGLDGDCVHGGELAALVVTGRGRGREVDKKVVRIRCEDYLPKVKTKPELGGS